MTRRILEAIDLEIRDLQEKIRDLTEKRKLFTASEVGMTQADIAEVMGRPKEPEKAHKKMDYPTKAEMTRRRERLARFLTNRKTFTLSDAAAQTSMPKRTVEYLCKETLPFKNQVTKGTGFRRGEQIWVSKVYNRDRSQEPTATSAAGAASWRWSSSQGQMKPRKD